MSSLKVGELFHGRYLIKAQLGSGGMGTVYRATQTDVGRDVALKLLRSDSISDDETVKRFYREFKILSRLENSHIVTIYGLALDENNLPYAICEFIEGRNLRSILQEGPLDWQRACKILIQVCEAMNYAHEQQVVHRDLKPDNIMLLDRPEPDFVKLIDFGLSRAAIVELDESQKLTFTGQLLGTPNYMSPEMAPNSVKSEIYALGCILFEALTAEYLFDADTAVGTLYLHASVDPSSKFEKIKSAPKEMFSVLKKALAKSPDERFGSMKEMQDSLEKILKQEDRVIAGSDFNVIKKKALFSPLALVVVGLAGAFMFSQLFQQKNAHVNDDVVQGFGSLKYVPISKLPPSFSNNLDLAVGETWLEENLKSTHASIEDISVVAGHCLCYRKLHQMEVKRPYTEPLLSKLDLAVRHCRSSRQKLLLQVRTARIYMLLGDKDKVLALATNAAALSDADDLRFVEELRNIIVESADLGFDSRPLLEMVVETGKKSKSYLTQASCYLLESHYAKEKSLQKTMALKAFNILINAEIARMAANPSLVLQCIQELGTCGSTKEIIRLGELVNCYFDTASDVSFLIQLCVVQAYLDDKQVAKSLRLAKALREKLLNRADGRFPDDVECKIITALSGRDSGSAVARDEAREYFGLIYKNSPANLNHSIPRILNVLDEKKKSRWMLNDLVDQYAEKLSNSHPEESRSLRMYRIKLMIQDLKKPVPDPALSAGKNGIKNRAINLLKDYSKAELSEALDLTTLENLSSYFAENGLDREYKECIALKTALEARLLEKIRK